MQGNDEEDEEREADGAGTGNAQALGGSNDTDEPLPEPEDADSNDDLGWGPDSEMQDASRSLDQAAGESGEAAQEESKDEPSQNVAVNDSDETPQAQSSGAGAADDNDGKSDEEFFDAKELLDNDGAEKDKTE